MKGEHAYILGRRSECWFRAICLVMFSDVKPQYTSDVKLFFHVAWWKTHFQGVFDEDDDDGDNDHTNKSNRVRQICES